MNLKQLNSTGRESFRAYLGALKAGEEPMVLPEMILSDDSQFESTHLVGELSLEEFPSRYAMGAHLVSLLSAYDLSELSGMDGLWDWVSLAWIDQLTKGKVDDEVNYIISGEYNRRTVTRSTSHGGWYTSMEVKQSFSFASHQILEGIS